MMELNYKYELYINDRFAARHLTAGGAEKEAAKRFPTAKVDIFKIIPTIDKLLVFHREASK